MLQTSNYHIHTNFCDGKSAPIEYVLEALAQNMDSIGFSAHAPLPFNCAWTIAPEKYKTYKKEIQKLACNFKQFIEVYCGVELDYIPDLYTTIEETVKPKELDYFIGSIHFIDQFPDGTRWCIDGSIEDFEKGWKTIFNENSQAVIQKYFEYTRQMVREMQPTIIGHIDKIKMQSRPNRFIAEQTETYQKEMLATLEEIAGSNSIVEINTRGVYRRKEIELYPSTWVLKEMQKMDIPVTINADAHRAEEVSSLYNQTAQKIKEIGFKSVKKLIKAEWVEFNL